MQWYRLPRTLKTRIWAPTECTDSICFDGSTAFWFWSRGDQRICVICECAFRFSSEWPEIGCCRWRTRGPSGAILSNSGFSDFSFLTHTNTHAQLARPDPSPNTKLGYVTGCRRNRCLLLSTFLVYPARNFCDKFLGRKAFSLRNTLAPFMAQLSLFWRKYLMPSFSRWYTFDAVNIFRIWEFFYEGNGWVAELIKRLF